MLDILEIEKLTNKLQEISTSEVVLEPETQEEIGNLLSIAANLKSDLSTSRLANQKKKEVRLEALIPNLAVAVQGVENNLNKTLVKKLRRDIEYSIRKIEYPIFAPFIELFKLFLYRAETHTKVCLGLLIALPFHLLAPVVLSHLLNTADTYLHPLFIENIQSHPELHSSSSSQIAEKSALVRISKYDFEEASALLLLSAIAGSTGSIVSIMLRLDQYRNPKYKETLLPLFIGAFKPAIGAFFGIFVFALISSTLLPITISKDETKPINRWLAFLAIAFVVGFSERLANDVVSQVEQLVPGSKNSPASGASSESEILIDESNKAS
jgi:hypothetical protein